MRDEFPGVERDFHTRLPLGTARAFHIRALIHQEYESPSVDFPTWALTRIHWRGDETVLEAGCGTGAYLDALRSCALNGFRVAGDLSLRMVCEMGERDQLRAPLPPLVTMDVQTLPFPDHTFDVALAGHILGYMPNPDRALAEIHRVLRPTGVLLAAANSRAHTAELDVLYRRACTLLGVPDPGPDAHAFNLENGALLLARRFIAVARYDAPSVLIFPDVATAMTYVQSLRPVQEPYLPPEITWDVLMEVMAALLKQVIGHFGALVVNKLSGVFAATDEGDFAAPFLRQLTTSTRWIS